MKQDELNKRNSDITIMLGWKEHKPESNWFWGKKEMTYYFGFDKVTWNTPRVYTKYFKYHSDWNWLMEAVEFIESKGYDVFINGLYCRITDSGMGDFEVESGEVSNKKEAVFIAVSDFAKLYKIWKTL